MQRCEKRLALDQKLADVLEGKGKPADDAECFALADVRLYRKHYAAAARLYRRVFADDPKLADKLEPYLNRYNAACSAARSGCGQGEDAKDLDALERAGWRKQALEWLRADLEAWTKRLDNGKPNDRARVADLLHHWLQDSPLSCLRDSAELAKLPADEQEACKKLWADVQALLDRAEPKK